jgi:hypothetical protein
MTPAPIRWEVVNKVGNAYLWLKGGALTMRARRSSAEAVEAACAKLNAHDELVAALETVARGVSPDMDTKDCDYLRAIARAVLAKVKP